MLVDASVHEATQGTWGYWPLPAAVARYAVGVAWWLRHSSLIARRACFGVPGATSYAVVGLMIVLVSWRGRPFGTPEWQCSSTAFQQSLDNIGTPVRIEMPNNGHLHILPAGED